MPHAGLETRERRLGFDADHFRLRAPALNGAVPVERAGEGGADRDVDEVVAGGGNQVSILIGVAAPAREAAVGEDAAGASKSGIDIDVEALGRRFSNSPPTRDGP